jgi:hypothetical protein
MATADKWTLSIPAAGVSEAGTYTGEGSTATLKSGTTTIGTASLSGATLTVKLNKDSGAEGTYTFTKQ